MIKNYESVKGLMVQFWGRLKFHKSRWILLGILQSSLSVLPSPVIKQS